MKLGYRPVRAIDFDPISVRTALANSRRNRISRRIEIVRSDMTRAPVHSRRRYEMVCANLQNELLLQECERIVNRLALKGGRLVLAGILAGQFPAVQTAYERAGLRLKRYRAEAGWASGMFMTVEDLGEVDRS